MGDFALRPRRFRVLLGWSMSAVGWRLLVYSFSLICPSFKDRGIMGFVLDFKKIGKGKYTYCWLEKLCSRGAQALQIFFFEGNKALQMQATILLV